MIRLLPYAVADGAVNMACDEVLVRSAAEGVASLRFYGWATPTVSLGYFQASAVRLGDLHLRSLPWVRRPTGGATLVHHHELTYAIALPAGAPWQRIAEPWMARMHRIITAALSDLGIGKHIEAVAEHPVKHGDVLCFQQHTPSDLLCLGNKVVGSAQRKYHQALLQHGSILLAQSEHTPVLPGIRELAGIRLTALEMAAALRHSFQDNTGWIVQEGDWEDDEKRALPLAVQKYASAEWNEKR